uniref:Uncharacterized protein n=1 Tax=Anguilla anguilla TaxID=7936 RepID=A0A0E9SPQ2_ANGAN
MLRNCRALDSISISILSFLESRLLQWYTKRQYK